MISLLEYLVLSDNHPLGEHGNIGGKLKYPFNSPHLPGIPNISIINTFVLFIHNFPVSDPMLRLIRVTCGDSLKIMSTKCQKDTLPANCINI